jgi:hypothetical protein
MKKLIVSVAALAVALVILPMMVHADDFYVIRDQYGHLAVTNGRPVYGWFTQSGPYSSIDVAQRATGTGTPPQAGYYNLLDADYQNFWFPQVVPRRPGQAPVVYLTP